MWSVVADGLMAHGLRVSVSLGSAVSKGPAVHEWLIGPDGYIDIT